MSAEPAAAGLSTQQTEDFQREGYVILEGFLAPGYNERLIAEVDELMADRASGGSRCSPPTGRWACSPRTRR